MKEKKYWFVFCQDELLLVRQNGQWTIPFAENPPVHTEPWTTLISPEDGYTALSIPAPVKEDDNQRMVGLRASFDLLSPQDYQRAGKCRELLFWHQNNRYCGCCGGPMKWNSPISKQCTMCGKEIWPNVAVATIVLIKRNEQVLLVQSHNFRTNFYGLVAGFVETGESLEECVRREVQEEVGLTIRNLQYFDSQPWPYPCGLMVGYYAEYDGGNIHLQRSELAAGQWFDRDHLPQLPQKLSIARRLIDAWIERRI